MEYVNMKVFAQPTTRSATGEVPGAAHLLPQRNRSSRIAACTLAPRAAKTRIPGPFSRSVYDPDERARSLEREHAAFRCAAGRGRTPARSRRATTQTASQKKKGCCCPRRPKKGQKRNKNGAEGGRREAGTGTRDAPARDPASTRDRPPLERQRRGTHVRARSDVGSAAFPRSRRRSLVAEDQRGRWRSHAAATRACAVEARGHSNEGRQRGSGCGRPLSSAPSPHPELQLPEKTKAERAPETSRLLLLRRTGLGGRGSSTRVLVHGGSSLREKQSYLPSERGAFFLLFIFFLSQGRPMAFSSFLSPLGKQKQPTTPAVRRTSGPGRKRCSNVNNIHPIEASGHKNTERRRYRESKKNSNGSSSRRGLGGQAKRAGKKSKGRNKRRWEYRRRKKQQGEGGDRLRWERAREKDGVRRLDRRRRHLQKMRFKKSERSHARFDQSASSGRATAISETRSPFHCRQQCDGPLLCRASPHEMEKKGG
ncbi:hypothetical protein HPB48_025604 [Haemaphysalis longicornis]|uniref:Uncharacterized protein n=1 Tax=Haemaphysalis longicornis TaxID=44386 RepID=A0A9J6H9V3_HAELO|nr:hypothetical protein HPB48_025604 [Haemaphysalis longicornis]